MNHLAEPGSMGRLLLVEDDEILGEVLQNAMARRGFEVTRCRNVGDARSHLRHHRPDYAVLDLRLPDGTGLALVKEIREASEETKIVVVTSYSSIATAVDAIKLGASNYLCKPIDADAIVSALRDDDVEVTGELPEATLSIGRLEWEHINRVLHENGGNISAAARALGLHRRTLQRKLSKHPRRQ